MNKSLPISNISVGGTLDIHFADNIYGQKSIPLGVFSRPMKSGVYEIVNLQNPEKTYIGKSNLLDARMKAHFYKLEHHTCISKLMQIDFDFSGLAKASDLFEFRIILYARPTEVIFYENLLINSLKPYYNQKKEKL